MARYEYFALTNLKLSANHFWNLTIDRFFKLMAVFLAQQKYMEQQMKKDVDAPDPDNLEKLNIFMKQQRKRDLNINNK